MATSSFVAVLALTVLAISRLTRRDLITYYRLWAILSVGLAMIALANLSGLVISASHALSHAPPGKAGQASVVER